jgi:hypothetical protein
VEVAARDAGHLQVGQDPVHHSGRPADVDVTLVDVRNELSEMARRQKVARRGIAVVADEVFDPSATRGRDRVELAAEDDV